MENPVFLVSAGDFYGGTDIYNEPKCHFIARVMRRLRYDAVALGDMDLNYGLDSIVEDSKRHRLNVLCANLFRRTENGLAVDDRSVFHGYKIVYRGGVRVGFIGVLSPSAKNKRAAAQQNEIVARSYVIKDPLPELVKLVPVVRKESDLVVLLAHMDEEDVERILTEVDGVDMVIRGHSGRPSATLEPVLIEGVPVYIASNQGQYMGRMTVRLGAGPHWFKATNEIRLLDRTVADDSEMASIVRAFTIENRKLQKALFVREQLKGHSETDGGQERFLGVATCQGCHAEAFDTFVHTAHAHAYQTLAVGFNHLDSNCLPCHSTGYGDEGGFSGARRIGSPVDLVDVQCEACHGPGADHNRDGSYLAAAKNSCVNCHTKEQDPHFDFEAAWKKIAH